jgi:hypothetical protein
MHLSAFWESEHGVQCGVSRSGRLVVFELWNNSRVYRASENYNIHTDVIKKQSTDPFFFNENAFQLFT